jgi:Protein of unknown function
VILAVGAILAAGAAWSLHRGPIPLPFLASRIARSLSDLVPDVVAKVGSTELAWSTRGPAIRVLDLELRHRDGTPLASSPRLSIRPSLRALVHAEFAIARIDVAGARLALVRSPDGQITVASAGTGLLASLIGDSGRAGPGYLSHIGLDDAQVTLDDRAQGVTWLAEGSQVDIRLRAPEVVARIETRLTLQSKASRILRDLVLTLSATASVRRDASGRLVDATIDARGEEGRVLLTDERASLPLRSLRLRASFSDEAQAVEVHALEATAGPAHLKSTARWSTGSGALEFRGEIGSVRTDDLPRLWPAGLATRPREWIARNLHDGDITDGRFALRFPGRAADGRAVAANEIEVQLGFTGLTAHYLRPLDPLRGAHGSAKLTATRFEMDVEGGSCGALSVHQGHMAVDLRSPGVPARVDVDVSGPTAELLTLLDRPPLGIPTRFGVQVDRAGGSGEVHAEFRFPLAEASGSKVTVSASADLRDASLPNIFYGVGIDHGRLRVRVDGERVDITGDTSLSGAPMIAGPLRVTLAHEPADGASVVRATFEGDALSVEAEATLDGQNLRKLTVPRLRFGRSDLSARLMRDPDGRVGISLAGESLDLEPFLRRFDFDAVSAPGGGAPWSLELLVRRMLAGHGLEFNDVDAAARGEGKDPSTVTASGTLAGGGYFRLALEPRDGVRHLTLSSDRGGEVLKAFSLYDHAEGGRLAATATLDPRGGVNRIEGEVEMRDFRIARAPVLAKVLSLGSLGGIADMLGGQGIAFSRARVPFAFSDDTLELRQATAVGTIGITAYGTVDRKGARIDVHGDVIPAYTLNSALGKLPLFGKFLVGGEGRGVFGIEYRVGGKPTEPDVKVNALSALAPGILRQIFVDPFTGERAMPTERPQPTGR